MTQALNLGVSTTPADYGITADNVNKNDLLVFFSDPEISKGLVVTAEDVKSTLHDSFKEIESTRIYKATKNTKDNQITVLEIYGSEISCYYRTLTV